METRNSRGPIAETLGGTAAQRGTKLGIVAGCLSIFLLFGGRALQQGNSNTVSLDTNQITSLVLSFLPGFLALVIAAVLAYYAGLSAPEAKSGEGARDGLIAGSITMLLFWVGQTLFVLIDGIRSPQGLVLTGFLQSRLLTAILFFVVGGALGWGGSRAAARRARSILSPATNSLNLSDINLEKPTPLNQPAQAEASILTSSSDERGEGDNRDETAALEAAADTPEEELRR